MKEKHKKVPDKDLDIKIESPEEKSIFNLLARVKEPTSAMILGVLIGGLGIMLALYHLTTSTFSQSDIRVHGGTHLCLVLSLVFLLFPLKRKSFKDPLNAYFWVDLFFFLASIGISIYASWDTRAMETRAGMPNDWDILLGTILVIVVLEAARRTMGWPIVLLSLFFLINVLYGPYFPGIFNGPPFSWSMAIDIIFLQNNGIFGMPIQVMSLYIILFMYFGAFLQKSRAGEFFIDLSLALAGRSRGGPAKVAVISSGLFGSISGSSVANVLGTGSFTIPMMKRIGYPPNYAGAVEACASTGGMIMPPVMGATAFLIAEFLAIPYWSVCVAAFIPALLYFFSVFMMVHFEAHKLNLEPMPSASLPRLREVIIGRGYTVISLVLMVVLFALGYSVVWACLAGLFCIIAVSFISPKTRMGPVDFLDAFVDGSRSALMVASACATCGIIIGCIFITGVGQRFTYLVLTASHGYMWVGLALTALATYVLGMGMPPAAVYLTLVILVIPALIKMGVITIASHMFAFYFGSIAAITPPVAMAAFAGAAISGGNPSKTGYIAMRIGIASYIIPFMFAYAPELLFEGPLPSVLLALGTAIVGIICLAAAMEGWFFRPCNLIERILLLGAALTLIKPGIYTDLVGVFLFGLAMLLQKVWVERKRRGTVFPLEEKGPLIRDAGEVHSSPEIPFPAAADLSPSPKSQLTNWKAWGPFVAAVVVPFWMAYTGIHFTRYWFFLVTLGSLSFFLVIYYERMMRKSLKKREG
jgi:TRAP transporter 4TM/12TM fusion protein